MEASGRGAASKCHIATSSHIGSRGHQSLRRGRRDCQATTERIRIDRLSALDMERCYSPRTKERRNLERQAEAAKRKEELVPLRETIRPRHNETRMVAQLDQLKVCWYRGYCGDQWDSHRRRHLGLVPARVESEGRCEQRGRRQQRYEYLAMQVGKLLVLHEGSWYESKDAWHIPLAYFPELAYERMNAIKDDLQANILHWWYWGDNILERPAKMTEAKHVVVIDHLDSFTELDHYPIIRLEEAKRQYPTERIMLTKPIIGCEAGPDKQVEIAYKRAVKLVEAAKLLETTVTRPPARQYSYVEASVVSVNMDLADTAQIRTLLHYTVSSVKARGCDFWGDEEDTCVLAPHQWHLELAWPHCELTEPFLIRIEDPSVQRQLHQFAIAC